MPVSISGLIYVKAAEIVSHNSCLNPVGLMHRYRDLGLLILSNLSRVLIKC